MKSQSCHSSPVRCRRSPCPSPAIPLPLPPAPATTRPCIFRRCLRQCLRAGHSALDLPEMPFANAFEQATPTGNRRFAAPVKVTELMLESPGHVVCRARHVMHTRRVTPMGADEELEGGEVYLLLPMVRMNCRASDEEMAWIDAACHGNPRSGGECKGVLPGGQVRCHVAGNTGSAGHRSTHGAWSPVLETICE